MDRPPERLESWNFEHVRELVERGVYEGDTFDFKSSLPHRSDEPGKQRLRKACAAFANSSGGFLIFGVSDDLTKEADERLVGIDTSLDFPRDFGTYPAGCEPAVHWEHKRPAIQVGAGRVVQIIFIPQSWKAPHAVQGRDGWVFPKRTNKGTEPMSYAEVQRMFLGFYEKRLKLELLKAELVQLVELSGRIALAPSEDFGSSSFFPTLELRVLETVLSDTYSITHSHSQFLSRIAQLRPLVQSLNSYLEIVRTSVAVHPQSGQQQRLWYRQLIESIKSQVKNLATETLAELEKILARP